MFAYHPDAIIETHQEYHWISDKTNWQHSGALTNWFGKKLVAGNPKVAVFS